MSYRSNTSSLALLFAFWCNACSSDNATPLAPANPDAGNSSETSNSNTMTPDAGQDPGSSAPATSDTAAPSEPSDATSSAGDRDAGSTSDSADSTDGSTALQDGGPSTSEPDSSSNPPGNDDAGSDGGAPDVWAGCPNVAVPSDESWPLVLNATPEATYCAMFNETRTLTEELAAKVQLRIAPGMHRVPSSDTEPFALPACIRDSNGVAGVTTGKVAVQTLPGEGTTTHSLRFDQALNGDARRLELTLEQTFEDGTDVQFVLDGVENEGFDSYQGMDLCDVDGDYCLPSIMFTSCNYASGELNTHTVEFEGGQVTLDLRIGETFAGTEPGAFVEARGSYAGQSFTQDDYFKLVYHPAHHHFERAFVVLFDAPRGDVCGIEVSGLEPFGDDIPDQAFTVDCELGHLSELAVTSHTLVKTTP